VCLQADAELFDLCSHAAKAHAVVLELHKLYVKRCMLIRGYQSLLLYLFFMVLYLTMLYMQRNAAEGHDVSSVIRNNVVPQQGTVKTWGDVFDYLSAQADMYWRDPTCGNGVCEAPFEFPSYARFGCAADCSFLVDAADIHPTQVLVIIAVVCAAALMRKVFRQHCGLRQPSHAAITSLFVYSLMYEDLPSICCAHHEVFSKRINPCVAVVSHMFTPTQCIVGAAVQALCRMLSGRPAMVLLKANACLSVLKYCSQN
jgi:hypothetical protein